jgi:O-succinylhomoserine sulfhydrylase
VHTTFVDGPDLDQWEQAITDAQPAAVFFETPSNPMQELVDIAAVADLAHGVGARVIVDNVFATPLGQRPLDLGADVVVYSTTKHIDGQGRTLGGAILGDEMFMLEHLTRSCATPDRPSARSTPGWR